jgi:hypothetical protein
MRLLKVVIVHPAPIDVQLVIDNGRLVCKSSTEVVLRVFSGRAMDGAPQ